MDLFDLHCDTATECYRTGRCLFEGSLPFKVPPYERWTQVMAVFLSDSRREAVRDFFDGTVRFVKKDMLSSCPDFSLFGAGGKKQLLLAVENCGWIGDAAFVNDAALAGIRLMSLSHNADNPLCGGAMGKNRGLSEKGRVVLHMMEKQNMVLDVSHCSDAAFSDIVAATDRPFIASHSNSRAVCDHPRNLTDGQIREIVARGGLIGLNFYRRFLHPVRNANPYSLLADHIDHMLTLGVENTLAIGSDIDGADISPRLDKNLEGLWRALRARYGRELTEKIFYQNAADFWNNRAH